MKRTVKRRTKPVQKPANESSGDDGLTNKQRIFIDEYLICWNASEAARRAGYSERTAYSIGSENLRKPEIRRIIEQRLSTMAMQADEVLARLSAIASADMSEFLTPSGRGVRLDLKRAHAAGQLHLVKKYNKTRQGVAVELYDAQAALVQLGKHHGLFAERIRLETWQSEIVEALKAGKLTAEDVVKELGIDDARTILVAAGQAIPASAPAPESSAGGEQLAARAQE